MSFSELPKIDKYSKNANKSETKFLSFFSQENNFITRTDVPDKGCDFDIELILENGYATNWRFPVQLKSVEKLKFIKANNYLSYSFDSSYLNYLLNRLPAMGLVVIYSLQKDLFYYEFADLLYKSIVEGKKSENWKKNKSVQLNIPIENTLSNTSVKEIYKIFHQRFTNSLIMQNTYGKKYSLPIRDLINDKDYNFENVDDIKSFLSKYGFWLINNYDLNILHKSLSKIPLENIVANKDLLHLSAVTFSEIGKYLESVFFIAKLKSKYELTDSELLGITFTELKNNLNLGYLTTSEFLIKLKTFDLSKVEIENRLIIQINIVRYELLEIKAFTQFPIDLQNTLDSINVEIKELEEKNLKREMFELWNLENQFMIVGNKLTQNLSEYGISRDLGREWSLEEKKTAIVSFLEDDKKILEALDSIYKKAYSENSKIIQAQTLTSSVSYFLHKEIIFLCLSDIKTIKEDSYKKFYGFAINAYNLFVELGLFRDAYYILFNALEILKLSKQLFDAQVEEDILHLTDFKINLEREIDIEPFKSLVPSILEKKSRSNENYNMPDFTKFTDEQIEGFSKNILNAYQLPADRLINIINEIKCYKLFQERCPSKSIILLQFFNEPRTSLNMYVNPINFVLRSILTGIETQPSVDMNLLLSSWGY